MITDFLPIEEQDALENICRFHGVDDKALIKDLATFGNWIHESEVARLRFGYAHKPPLLLVLLSKMGIYGKAVLKG
jgi:hypothetical protein